VIEKIFTLLLLKKYTPCPILNDMFVYLINIFFKKSNIVKRLERVVYFRVYFELRYFKSGHYKTKEVLIFHRFTNLF